LLFAFPSNKNFKNQDVKLKQSFALPLHHLKDSLLKMGSALFLALSQLYLTILMNQK